MTTLATQQATKSCPLGMSVNNQPHGKDETNGSLDDRALGMKLMAAGTELQLSLLVERNGHRFTPIHVSQALLRLWRLSSCPRGRISKTQKLALIATLAEHVSENIDSYDCQGLGICAFALARLGASNETAALGAIATRVRQQCAQLSYLYWVFSKAPNIIKPNH
eukprot:scaffold53316_cov32-Prasinocladus_malaysianus.AAC.1